MKTLEQEVRNATDDKVNADRLAEHTAAKRIDNELNQLPIHVHAAVLADLNVKLNLREQAMKMYAAEWQRQAQMGEALKEQAVREAAFAKRQAEVVNA